MKFGRLIEYNIRHIFLEKSWTKCSRETTPGPFFEKWNLSIFLGRQFEFLYSLFLLYVQVEDYQNILKLRYRPLAFTSNKACLKNRKRSGTSLSTSFSVWFLKKKFFMLYSINWPNFIAIINFEIYLSFLIKPDIINFEI